MSISRDRNQHATVRKPISEDWSGSICFGLVLWHINHWRLFNAKSFLYIYMYKKDLALYIKYIGFGLIAYQPL